MKSDEVLRFGTRGSALARAQTDLVIRRLQELHPDVRCEVIVIQTEGDRDKETPLTVIGGRGVFTNALQDALRRTEIDVAVHSAKDLPTEAAPDLKIAAFLERADPRDVFVSRHGKKLRDLSPNPVIGTSSRRRQVQVRKLRPDAQLVDLRGNIDTRLRKAFETELDGIVLAAAGLERMGWLDKITEYLPLGVAVPSPGQGALAVEIRADDIGPASAVADLDDPEVSTPVKIERAFLRGTGGGCASPVGAHATHDGWFVRLRAMLGRPDGSKTEWIDARLPVDEAEIAAEAAAKSLLARLEQPLAGKFILVVRGERTEPIFTQLGNRGAIPVVAPVTRIELIEPAYIEAALDARGGTSFDWIVFTSSNAVDAFLRCRRGFEFAKNALVAAVGASTADRLQAWEIEVSLRPSTYSAEALVAELAKRNVSTASVLFPHGDLARSTVPDGLRALGAAVEMVNVYRTVTVEEIDPGVLAEISSGIFDAVMFFSPSSVHALKFHLNDRFDALKSATIACIGQTTAAAAREAGVDVQVVPDESSIDALIDDLENYYATRADQKDVLIEAGESGEGRALL